MKAFFYLCAGIFLLALSYHLGASTARAQGPGNPIVGIAGFSGAWMIVTENGDAYLSNATAPPGTECVWARGCNIFGGPPIPVRTETFGGIKARYR